MEPPASYAPGREPGWRRYVVGLVLRSAITVAGYALLALAVFVVAVIWVDRSLVDDRSVLLAVLYVPYVVLGTAAGAAIGLAKVLRRESEAIVRRAGWLVRPVVERALAEISLGRGGVETATLRRAVEVQALVPRDRGRIVGWLGAFAVTHALETAGLLALQERLLALVERAEARGETVVARELVEAAARDGLGAAVTRRLNLGWQAQQATGIVVAALVFVSLPALAYFVA